MPADTLTVSIPAPLADEVRAAAEARGLSPEDYVRQQLAWDIATGDGSTPSDGIEDDLAAIEDFERHGVGIPAEEVEAWLQSLTTDHPLPRPRPRTMG